MTTITSPSSGVERSPNEAAGRIIGGMFGLPELEASQNSPPPFFTGRKLLLVNGQSGISILADRLSPGSVWMPSYLCRSIVQAARRGDISARFYEVGYDLAIPSLDWVDRVRPGDLVLLIDYFGFPSETSCAARAKERGAWVLRDACQALLSEAVGPWADFTLFSPRKFLGVPDGGVLQVNCAIEFEGLVLESPPANWWLRALRASVLRREFDLYGGTRRWFELFQKSEAEAPRGPFEMSELSRNLLMHCFDYVWIAERRRENYAVLSSALRDFAIFPDLPARVVPLGFPMRTSNRDRLRQALFDRRIYPPVHWPIAKVVPAEFKASHQLAADILTLPCDQRYDADDMERIARLVLEASRS